jgi:hypothetical protein
VELHLGVPKNGAPHIHWPGALSKAFFIAMTMMCWSGGPIDEHAGLILWNFAMASHPSFPCITSLLWGCQATLLEQGMQDFGRGGCVKGDGPQHWCWGLHSPFSCAGSGRVHTKLNARQGA